MAWVDITVPFEAAGARLDVYLAQYASRSAWGAPLAGCSRSRVQAWIASGSVRLLTGHGQTLRAATKLRGGETVRIELPAPQPLALTPVPMSLDILYEDEDMIAVSKPAGLLMHPGAGRREPTLVHGLLAHCQHLAGIGGIQRPGIVHRLDRGTSGVVVVAKNDAAHESLSLQFAQRRVHKTYVAWVLGHPCPSQARLETWYGRHLWHRQRFTSRVSQGRRAITCYQVLANFRGISRLAIQLETGRTHQIRVHMSEQGWPIVGDPLYGGQAYGRLENLYVRQHLRQLTHQALHASDLELTHPVSGVRLRLHAPLPSDLSLLACWTHSS